jgi:hypothetical protein
MAVLLLAASHAENSGSRSCKGKIVKKLFALPLLSSLLYSASEVHNGLSKQQRRRKKALLALTFFWVEEVPS